MKIKCSKCNRYLHNAEKKPFGDWVCVPCFHKIHGHSSKNLAKKMKKYRYRLNVNKHWNLKTEEEKDLFSKKFKGVVKRGKNNRRSKR